MGSVAAMAPGERVFASSSVTMRRFPALRSLTADDVEVMVMPASSSPKGVAPPKGADKSNLFDPNLVKPSALGSLGGAAPKATSNSSSPKSARPRPPFRPCNPTEAKSTITNVSHGYVGIHSPYDLAHRLQSVERAEANKHILGGIYLPNAPSQARKAIQINYFLNSPDAETIEAERR